MKTSNAILLVLLLAAVIVINDAKASNVYGNFGGCTATPNPGWDCRGDAPAGGTITSNIDSYGSYESGLTNVGGDGGEATLPTAKEILVQLPRRWAAACPFVGF